MASQVLYYFESNTRSATIIGIVGAGGIGMHLYEQIKVLEWQSRLVPRAAGAGSRSWSSTSVSARLRIAIIGGTGRISELTQSHPAVILAA